MSETMRVAIFVTLTSMAAIGSVLITACCSIGLTLCLQSILTFVVYVMATVGEIGVAVIAALASGFTVSLTVILSATTSAVAFPPSSIKARLIVAIVVATGSIVTSALALVVMTTVRLDIELGIAVVSSAAASVAFASAWAVGVMSLVERETHHVGLKMTSLLQAVRHNKYHVLSLLVRLPLGSREGETDTALLYAVKAGFVECVRVLITSGANPNVQDAYNCTPLISASQLGSVEMITMLLDAEAVVNLRNGSRETALHHAAKSGHEECVRLLLERGADPEVQDSLWRTPLMLTIRHARNPAPIIGRLLDAGSYVNTIGSDHRSALHYACARGINIRVLLCHGADVSKVDTEGNTALHLATLDGSYENTRLLLAERADPNVTNSLGRSALHTAALGGSVQCLELLTRAEALKADCLGHTPISLAVLSRKELAALYFLRHNHFHGAVRNFCEPTPESQRHYRGESELNCTSIGIQRPSVSMVNPLSVSIEKGCYNLSRALLLGGCVREAICEEYLTQANNRIQVEPERQAEWRALKACFYEPWGLSDICRLVIRRRLRHPETDSQRLPLPSQIREFLLLRDLEEQLNKSTNSPVINNALCF